MYIIVPNDCMRGTLPYSRRSPIKLFDYCYPFKRNSILFTLLFVSIFFFNNGTYAQDYCYSCNYDSLYNQKQIKKKPEEKMKLLIMLADPPPTFYSVPKVKVELLDKLISEDRKAKIIDDDPILK